MSTKITSPIEGFDGRSVFGPVTLEFTGGVAETDEKLSPGLQEYLTGRGYTVETGVEVPDGEPAKSWTKPQLVAWAEAHDVDLAGASTKDDVLAVISAGTKSTPPADGQSDGGMQGGGNPQ